MGLKKRQRHCRGRENVEREKFQKRCCLPIKGKKKKNLGSDRTQGRLTGQQNQAQFPSCCEHDDNSCIKGKE